VILDTNAISALADGDVNLGRVLRSAKRHQIPVIVLGEYRYGLKRSKECALRERWLDELELNFDVLEVSSKTAKHYAQIREELRRNGTPIPENDIWISAIVREHEIELLSKDRHFDVVRGLSRKEW